MIGGTMQTLPIILDDQLPVAGFNDIFLTSYFGLGQLVWLKIRSERFAYLLDIRRCRCGKADINKTTDHCDFYGIQSEIFLWKVGLHATRVEELSTKVICPVMVG